MLTSFHSYAAVPSVGYSKRPLFPLFAIPTQKLNIKDAFISASSRYHGVRAEASLIEAYQASFA